MAARAEGVVGLLIADHGPGAVVLPVVRRHHDAGADPGAAVALGRHVHRAPGSEISGPEARELHVDGLGFKHGARGLIARERRFVVERFVLGADGFDELVDGGKAAVGER